ncbi:MAG TPA: NAD(P)/FAD-dependent oxidoreductase [Solirubrobacteraceae bacterium]|nr:NAD(P)/FAD-dependent oxidoreductase [Solirubrobacteraceae bacterium]
MPRDVVIAGGGFGGYYAARKLERLAPDDVRITLINDVNFLLYAPLLPGAAASTLDPRHVVVPLREHLRRTELRMGWVTDGEPDRNTLKVKFINGDTVDYSYDQLVVAMGSVSRTFPIPGLVEHAIGFKTIAEATALRNRVVRHLELAEGIDDPEERRPWLSFVFVGGGYAGLEGVAFLADFAADIIKRYPRCREVGTRWTLIDAAPRVMPEIQPQLAEFTVRLLEGRGIDFRLSTQVEEVFDDRVRLSDGEVIPARTVCWTAGVKANPVAERMGLPLEKGRIKCDEFLRVPGFDNVWAVGDIASIPDPARPGNPCPPTAQHAIRQGKLLGRNVAVALGRRGELKPFTFKTLGSFAELGRHKAVADLMGLRLRGFPAWAVCRFYHLAWMPGLDRKSRLIADWSTEIIFPRDIAEMGQLGHPPRLDGPAPPPREEPQPEALPDAPAEETDSPAANQGTPPSSDG